MSAEFITIDRNTAEAIKAMPTRNFGRRRPLSTITQQLLLGEMVFTVDKRWKPSAKTFTARGFRLHTRRDDGGTYYWTTVKA